MAAFDDFTAAVRSHSPSLAIVLGSGLGSAPPNFEVIASISFAEVPGHVAPTVRGHSGTIDLGICAKCPLLVIRGRLHFYEGHSWDRVAGPINLAADLGVKTLLLTNAAGGIHDSLWPGDLMVLRGHLFLQRHLLAVQVSNLCGHPHRLETYATAAPYSARLVAMLQKIELERSRPLLAGIYAAVTGPCYETPAEIRALRAMGADAVGMSTAFEAKTGGERGMEVAAISCITNKAAGLTAGVLDHREVLANAAKPASRLSEIVESLLPRLSY